MRLFSLFFCSLLWTLVCGQKTSYLRLGLEEGLPDLEINAVLQAHDGGYWISVDGSGLVYFDGYTFSPPAKSLQLNQAFVYALAQDSLNHIWLGLEGAVLAFDGRNQRRFPLRQGQRAKRILCHSGRVFVLTDKGELWRIHQDETNSLAEGVRDFTIVERDLILLKAEGRRMEVYSTKGKAFKLTRRIDLEEPTQNAELAYSYRGAEIDSLFQSTHLSSNTGGKVAMSDGQRLWLEVDGQKRELDLKLSEATEIKQLYFDRLGLLWVATNDGLKVLYPGFSAFYPQSEVAPIEAVARYKGALYSAGLNSLRRIAPEGAVLNSPNYGTVQKMLAMDDGLYIASERGLYKFESGRFSKLRLSSGLDFIFSLQRYGDSLLVASSNGLYRYFPKDRSVIQLRAFESELPVFAVEHNGSGKLWAYSFFGGFSLLDQGRWLRGLDLELNRALDSVQITQISAAGGDQLWMLSNAGELMKWTGSKLITIPSNLLSFAQIKAMQWRDGRLWLGSNKGLYVLMDRPDLTGQPVVIKLETRHAYAGGEVARNALQVQGDSVLLGTLSGFQLYDASILRWKAKPKMKLNDIELFFGDGESPLQYAADSSAFDVLPTGLQLPYDRNFINFEFSGIHPLWTAQMRYRHRLKGDNWTFTGTRREAIFTSLQSDRYSLEAAFSLDGEEWIPLDQAYEFEIQTPFYQTWWFIGLIVLSASVIVYFFVRERLLRVNQRLRLENQLMEMERKALRLQMNPHFIFNALDSISAFIFKKDPKMAVRYLNNFAKLMRLTLESSMEHLHPVETEVSILKNYLELEQLRFNDKFSYEIEVDEEIDYDVGLPPMLIQPHVENAILHGIKPKVEKGHIAIRFKLMGEFLICEIEDDGIGRTAAKAIGQQRAHRSMATRINRDRIRLLKQASKEEISIEIIDKFDGNNKPTGTLVILNLKAEPI